MPATTRAAFDTSGLPPSSDAVAASSCTGKRDGFGFSLQTGGAELDHWYSDKGRESDASAASSGQRGAAASATSFSGAGFAGSGLFAADARAPSMGLVGTHETIAPTLNENQAVRRARGKTPCERE